MADTTLPGILLTGDHASRPAANAVASGALYQCDTHSLIYQSDGSSWSTWATLGGGAVDAADVTFTPAGSIAATDVQAAIEEVAAEASGAGVTREYLGYNTAGGSSEVATGLRVYMKKISVVDACDLLSVQAYLVGETGSKVTGMAVGLFSDSSGSPLTLLAYNNGQDGAKVLMQSATNGVDRWIGLPLNYELAASTDYWIAWQAMDNELSIKYDGSGSDKYYTSGGNWLADAGFYTVNTSSNKYSIRARVIR